MISKLRGFSLHRGYGVRNIAKMATAAILFFNSLTAFSQSLEITGKVVDENNAPIFGVTVFSVEDSKFGTITDFDGNYSLIVPANSTLRFSYIGFQSQDIQVMNQSIINVTLESLTSQLDEVVVIGYGTTEKKDVTGAVSTISSDLITQAPVGGLEQAIQGRVAGLTVVQDGSPGGSPSVRIRGIGTIGNNNPLYVIDGVQTTGGLNSLNPGDIESISVLKDASSAAIYGTRAANGVIIVTTKRGRKNTPTQVSLSILNGFQQAWKHADVLNAPEYARVIRESRVNANTQRTANGSTDLLPLVPEFDNPDSQVSLTNWQDKLFRSGHIQEYKLDIAGGNETTNFSFSTSIRDEEGIILNSLFRRYTGRVSLDHAISEKLNIGATLFYSHRNSQGVPNNDIWNGALQSALTMPENFPVRNADGNFAAPTGGNAGIYGNSQNPVAQALRSDNSSPINRVLGNVFSEWEMLEGLKFKSMYAVDLTSSTSKYFQPTFAEGSRPTIIATLSQSSGTSSWWGFDNTLTYTKMFNNHDFSLVVGTSAQKESFESFSSSRQGFPEGNPEGLRYLDFGGQGSDLVSGSGGTATLLSYFGRFGYSYLDKYLLSATLRRDGSSRFTEGNRVGTFPSASLGWRISNENFLNKSEFLTNLMVRASWGKVGNQDVGSYYPYVTTVGFNNRYNYVFNGQLFPGAAVQRLGNPDLTWETTEMKNFGIDMDFLNSQIVLSADYFVNDTRDILLQVPLPQLIGQVQTPNVNAGNVRNDGLELVLSYNSAGDQDFNYSISANASFLNNKVTSLSTATEIIANNDLRGSDPVSRAIVGEPIGSFFGFVTDGLFQSQEEVTAHAFQEPNTAPGDFRYKDLNNDGVITGEDRAIIGNGFPDVTYGINFGADYKRFDLAVFFQGVNGVSVFNGLEYLTMNNVGGNKSAKILDHWTPENTNTTIPRLTWDDPNRNSRVSDRYVQDASYLRLKTVQLGYNFGLNVIQALGIKHLRAYISGQNLLTFTSYDGLDPEVTGSDLAIGVDQGIYPQARLVMLGIDVKF
ncbi:SusC/RagA family TonB-linked outer membrane protein [Lunatibacter salilacus]|uniref:SusC/RagA family TonB-linked outer membrane protein n=1 Tax=Lunatibacter salilacus TaxID=2483804 RepID=UPI00131E305D|nr:TonB-dependent receptor [Lunatibacter salilacus]